MAVVHAEHKSIRLPSDMVEYINQQEGCDFSKKLMKILEEYRDGDQLRAYKISLYDSMIADRSSRLEDLTSRINDALTAAAGITGGSR